VSLDVEGEVLHQLGLAVDLMDEAMGLETVDCQQGEAIAEDVEVVLVVGLTLVQ
jgi:hypothetical protein